MKMLCNYGTKMTNPQYKIVSNQIFQKILQMLHSDDANARTRSNKS